MDRSHDELEAYEVAIALQTVGDLNLISELSEIDTGYVGNGRHGRPKRNVIRKRKNLAKYEKILRDPLTTDVDYIKAYTTVYEKQPEFIGGKLMRHVLSLTVDNIVVTATLRKGVDLTKMKKAFAHMGAEYSKTKKFPSLGLHFATDKHHFRAAMSVFGTGRIVCPGCQTNYGTLTAIFTVATLLEKDFPGIGPPEILPRNIVGGMTLDQNIDLKVLYCYIKAMVDAEPDAFHPPTYGMTDFPGLQWRSKTKLMFLVFSSGAVVITNGRSAGDISEGAKMMYDMIQDCKVKFPGSVIPKEM